MVLFPRIGRAVWMVTDWDETLCAVPVTIIRREQADLWELMQTIRRKPKYAVRWQIVDCGGGASEYHEDYYINTRRELYTSERAARKAAQKALRRWKKQSTGGAKQ